MSEPSDWDYEKLVEISGLKAAKGAEREARDEDHEDTDDLFGDEQAARDDNHDPSDDDEDGYNNEDEDRFWLREARRQMNERDLQQARKDLTQAEVYLAACQTAYDTFDQRLAAFLEWQPIMIEVFGTWPEDPAKQTDVAREAWEVYPKASRGLYPEHPGTKDQVLAERDQALQAVIECRNVIRVLEAPVITPRRSQSRRGPPVKHGYAGQAASRREKIIYAAWENMKSRCSPNPTANDYAYYYGRGIRICDRWLRSFPNFLADVLPIFETTWTPGRIFDRINNDGHYEPGNVEWRTRTKSNQNRRKP